MIFLPMDRGWRMRNRQTVNAWLSTNRIDPSSVPIDGGIRIENNLIYYDAVRGTPLPLTATQRNTVMPGIVVRSIPIEMSWTGPLEGEV